MIRFIKIMTGLAIALCFFAACHNGKDSFPEGIYARVSTAKGDIIIELYYDKTPFSAAHFITLAQGTNPYVADSLKGVKYYDESYFFDESAGYIAGGDHTGTGNGSPGYFIAGEFPRDGQNRLILRHDTAGVVSWTKDRKGHNGSSFVIAKTGLPARDGIYTVFGKVIKGISLLDSLHRGDKILRVKIITEGNKAKAFDAGKTLRLKLEKWEKELAEKYRLRHLDTLRIRSLAYAKRLYFKNLKPSAFKLPTGMKMVYLQKNHRKRPSPVDTVAIRYSGYFTDGELFITNDPDVLSLYNLNYPGDFAPHDTLPFTAVYNRKMPLIQGLKDAVLNMSYGDKTVVYLPYYLAYGITGSSRVPPETDVVFVVEILPKHENHQ